MVSAHYERGKGDEGPAGRPDAGMWAAWLPARSDRGVAGALCAPPRASVWAPGGAGARLAVRPAAARVAARAAATPCEAGTHSRLLSPQRQWWRGGSASAAVRRWRRGGGGAAVKRGGAPKCVRKVKSRARRDPAAHARDRARQRRGGVRPWAYKGETARAVGVRVAGSGFPRRAPARSAPWFESVWFVRSLFRTESDRARHREFGFKIQFYYWFDHATLRRARSARAARNSRTQYPSMRYDRYRAPMPGRERAGDHTMKIVARAA